MRCTHIGIVLIASVLASQAASAADLVVIVNSANPTAAMDAKSVKAHFLKTKAAWADGEAVRPVDHSGEAKQRAARRSSVRRSSVKCSACLGPMSSGTGSNGNTPVPTALRPGRWMTPARSSSSRGSRGALAS